MKTSYDRATNGRRAYLEELLISVYDTSNIVKRKLYFLLMQI